MNKTLKKILSLALIAVILCCPFANVAQSAHAIGPEDALIAECGFKLLAILFTALAAAGITFGTRAESMQAMAQYVHDNPLMIGGIEAALKSQVTVTPEIDDKKIPTEIPGAVMTLNSQTYTKFIELIESIKKYFSRSKDTVGFTTTIANQYKMGDAVIQGTLTGSTMEMQYNNCYYTNVGIVTVTDSANKMHTYSCAVVNNILTMKYDGQLCAQYNGSSGMTINASTLTDFSFRWGIFTYVVSGVTYLYPVIRYRYKSNGVYTYTGYGNPAQWYVGSPAILVSALVPATSTKDIGYDYEIEYSDSEYYNALEIVKNRLAADGMTMDISLTGSYGDVKEGTDEDTKGQSYVGRWAAILTSLGILDLVRTLKQSATVTEKDLDTPKMPVDIKDKFPFCVPFDLIALVTALNAPAVVPSATIPIKFSALHYESSMTIDLAQFEGVAKAVRWGMTILYLFGLTVLTRKLIKG